MGLPLWAESEKQITVERTEVDVAGIQGQHITHVSFSLCGSVSEETG